MWLLFVALCLVAGEGAAATARVKIALSSAADPENSGTYVWARELAVALEEEGFTTAIYPSSTLGTEVVREEQVRLGLLEVNVSGGQDVGLYSQLYRALEMPFRVEDERTYARLATETSLIKDINSDTLAKGIRLVDFVFLGGMSGLFTARHPVDGMADLASLRMRAMEAEQITYFEAWGGQATQVAWEEVPQALSTGVADGYLNPPIVAVLFGHGPQLDYFTNLRITPSMRAAVVSERWYAELSADARKAVLRSLTRARGANARWLKRTLARELDLLRDIGIQVIEVSEEERERFSALVEPRISELVAPAVLARLERYIEELE